MQPFHLSYKDSSSIFVEARDGLDSDGLDSDGFMDARTIRPFLTMDGEADSSFSMGASVASVASDGFADRASDGFAEGASDGFAEGASDGFAEGASDGFAEGASTGFASTGFAAGLAKSGFLTMSISPASSHRERNTGGKDAISTSTDPSSNNIPT